VAPVPRDFDTLARQAQQALRDGTPLPSPCIGVCRIGDAGVCVGCARRLDEIGGLPLMEYANRRVRRKLGKNMSWHLEAAWRDIGKWIA